MAVAKAPAKPAKKKFFKEIAVINADNCTGCDACVEVCPVDCIYKVPGEDLPHLWRSAILTSTAASAARCANGGARGTPSTWCRPRSSRSRRGQERTADVRRKNWDRLVRARTS